MRTLAAMAAAMTSVLGLPQLCYSVAMQKLSARRRETAGPLSTTLRAAAVPEYDLDSSSEDVPPALARRAGTATGAGEVAKHVARFVLESSEKKDRVPCPTESCFHCRQPLVRKGDHDVSIHSEDGVTQGVQETKRCPACNLVYYYNMAIKYTAGGRRAVFIGPPDDSFLQFTDATIYDNGLITLIAPQFTNFTSATMVADQLEHTMRLRENVTGPRRGVHASDRRRLQDAYLYDFIVRWLHSRKSTHGLDPLQLDMSGGAAEVCKKVHVKMQADFQTRWGSEHQCNKPGCGEVQIADGGCKAVRAVCDNRAPAHRHLFMEVLEEKGMGKSVPAPVHHGCRRTPEPKGRFCRPCAGLVAATAVAVGGPGAGQGEAARVVGERGPASTTRQEPAGPLRGIVGREFVGDDGVSRQFKGRVTGCTPTESDDVFLLNILWEDLDSERTPSTDKALQWLWDPRDPDAREPKLAKERDTWPDPGLGPLKPLEEMTGAVVSRKFGRAGDFLGRVVRVDTENGIPVPVVRFVDGDEHRTKPRELLRDLVWWPACGGPEPSFGALTDPLPPGCATPVDTAALAEAYRAAKKKKVARSHGGGSSAGDARLPAHSSTDESVPREFVVGEVLSEVDVEGVMHFKVRVVGRSVPVLVLPHHLSQPGPALGYYASRPAVGSLLGAADVLPAALVSAMEDSADRAGTERPTCSCCTSAVIKRRLLAYQSAAQAWNLPGAAQMREVPGDVTTCNVSKGSDKAVAAGKRLTLYDKQTTGGVWVSA